MMVLKTSSRSLAALEKLIMAEHPYDTPEFVVLPLTRAIKISGLARSSVV